MRISSGAIVAILSSALPLLLTSSGYCCEAFVVTTPTTTSTTLQHQKSATAVVALTTGKSSSLLVLYAEEGGGGEAEAASEEGESAEESADAEVEVEDPEVTSLKEEIASLEKTLSEKRLEKNTLDRLVENYSESGYARKVAEMENVRKLRSLAFIDNKSTAKASIVQNFLPVLDALTTADTTHASSPFTSNYAALRGNFNTALKELDVTEYAAPVGSPVDKSRFLVKESVYSNDYEKDVVVKPISVGYEIQGNVMRMAECVVSLGSEEDAKKKAEEEEEAAANAESEEEDADEGESPQDEGSFE